MLKQQSLFNFTNGFRYELEQAMEEGKNVSSCTERVKEILAMDDFDSEKQRLAAEIYDEIQKLPIRAGHQYSEPSDLEGIKAERFDSAALCADKNISDEEYYDKVYGAWLGRCAGCLLGKPVEGWSRTKIVGLLKDTGNYPVKFYMSSDISLDLKEKYEIWDLHGSWINQVEYMPEDDDTNYTVIGLKIFQRYGADFTPDDVAESWLNNLPILHLCTAERVAYRNFTSSIFPPESASFRNPYREWIGAQIRADFFGYVTPGSPELAAEFAWRDASISHIKNGIYGEMFVAAMLSAAAVTQDVNLIIETGLSQIPLKSRLYESIRKIFKWKKDGITWEEVLDRIHTIYDEKKGHHWCHTISNAMIVCTALLYGDGDFEKSISIALLGALDTDCNAATTGSILGMMIGAKALPEKWIAPLNDQLRSGVDGFGLVKISDMAAKTMQFRQQV